MRIALHGAISPRTAEALATLGEVRTVDGDGVRADDDLAVCAGGATDLASMYARLREASPDTWVPLLLLSSEGWRAALDAGADDVSDPEDGTEEVIARASVLLKLKTRYDEAEERAAQFTDWTRTLVGEVAEQVEQLQRVERLRRFLSPQVADVVAGDEKLLESHRREIAVVFCDLRGFTAFSEVAEPEEVMGVLREYHAILGEIIFRFGATLERFAGDAILAFFNDPVPCPEPAASAVRMAVAMRERVRALVPSWRKRGHDLDFGVGIAVGYATLGRIGFDGRSDYGAVGSVVNLAARLCAEALGGQILLSERAHGLVADIVDVTATPGLQLKGFHKAVTAYDVTRLRDARNDLRTARS